MEHIWDMLGSCVQAREPPVLSIRQLEAAWQQLSQQDIRRLNGGMRRITVQKARSLSFHFQEVTFESLDDIYCSKFSTWCNPNVHMDDGLNPASHPSI
jgi:hypothetical protein